MKLLQAVVMTLLTAFVAVDVNAQELTGATFEQLLEPYTVPMQQRDLNGNICALIKVQLPVVGCKFEGSVITTRFETTEYWVYMAPGAKRLDVKCPGYRTCSVIFGDISPIVRLQEKSIYSLSFDPVATPGANGGRVDDGWRYLVLTVEPATATVLIDNQLQAVSNGSVVARLLRGSHSYRVEAAGYAPQSATVELTEERQTVSVRLESTQAQLRVECPTQGAQIYVNGSQQGAAPWTGSLAAGNYLIEARLDGHIAQEQSITLAERDNRTVSLPALVALTGALDVNYMPIDAEVWIDGTKAGTSPFIFRDIAVGNHTVEIRADGYQSDRRTVAIEKDQTAALQGTLTRQQSAVAQQSGGQVEPFTVNGVSFNMVRVEGGTFQMGATSEQKNSDSDEKPVHSVTLSSYYIGETEVTQALWQAVMGTTVRQQRDKADTSWAMRGEGTNYPMYYISYKECEEFIERLNSLTNRNFRLPTEAEWEFAARGGTKSRGYQYSGSKKLKDVAWYTDNSGDNTHPVKTKAANELGLYDMSGNVWEWCADWYGDYSSDSQTNPTGPSSGSYRVSRGGSWLSDAWSCRVADRYDRSPGRRSNGLGLRLAL